MSKITYSTKSDINTTATPEVNKVTAANMNEIKTVVNNNTPAGSIILYSGTAVPTGWLICDGSAVSRTTYSSLFTAIGTTYGAGNGSTIFNLPNLKGKVPIGQDNNDTAFDTLGETGGNKIHRHFNGVYAYNNKLTISNNNSQDNHPTGNMYSVNGTTGFSAAGSGNTFAYSTESSSNLQPYIVLNYIISY